MTEAADGVQLFIRRSADRGHFDHGWLKTFHSFSFADYFDPGFMGFRALRVINEDFVQAGNGFPTHGHRDMEIITYVLEGELTHKDSLGTGSVIRPGEIQRMTAGTGVRHSEYNHSPNSAVHLLQIWIIPEQEGLTPGYEQKAVAVHKRPGELVLIASPEGGEDGVRIHQDVRLYAAVVKPGQTITQELDLARSGWLQVARGSIAINGTALSQGDGAAIRVRQQRRLVFEGDGEFLFFDLA